MLSSPQDEFGWRVVSASVRGVSHIRAELPCQDAHAWTYLENGILVAAVADGAGSATLSDVGANVACRSAIEAAAQLLQPLPKADDDWRETIAGALLYARNAIEQEAEAREIDARELATTLILAIAAPDVVAVVQIGDGAAVVADETGEIHALTTPTRGEYANETVFLTAPNARDLVQGNVWHGSPAHLALFSDGLQMLALKMPEGTPHAPFFAPLFRFVTDNANTAESHAQLESFLTSPRITDRADDDLTLLLAART